MWLKNAARIAGVLFGITGLGMIFTGDIGPGLLGILIFAVAFLIPDSNYEKWQKGTKETAENYKESRAKNNSERQINLTRKSVVGSTPLSIRRDSNGLYYFKSHYDEEATRYEFDSYEWEGANLETHTTTKGKVKQQGRAGSALVGGLVGGRTGATIGAARGRKGKVNTTSTAKEVEKDSVGKLVFVNTESNQYEEIKVKNNRETDSKIRAFFKI